MSIKQMKSLAFDPNTANMSGSSFLATVRISVYEHRTLLTSALNESISRRSMPSGAPSFLDADRD
uniref:Uncharacterized protein n=1 Tax=Picea sitchensis TaxID=3332 RepID=A0A6B9XVA3_PICSI|nr:hypothetical protein Q903MT_gene6909 [Picea sitchensis]